MKWLAAILPLVAAAAIIGCGPSRNSVTEGDRLVNHQNLDGASVALAALEEARGEIPEGSKAWGLLGVGATVLKEIHKNSAHLQEVHGPPEKPKPFSTENSAAARQQSTEEHARSGLTDILLTGGGIVAGLAGAWFGMPWLATLFPSRAGKIGELAKTGVEIITSARKKAEESGGQISVKDLLAIAKEFNVSAGVDDLAKKKAAEFEEKLGFEPTIKLAQPPPEPVPAS